MSTAPLRLVTADERGVRVPAGASRPVVESETQLRALLGGLSGVDAVGAEARAAKLTTRSLKKSTKVAALDLAISMVDLTTLEGSDTPGRATSLCTKARRPDPSDESVPSAAAVCVYPDLVEHARHVLGGSSVKVAFGDELALVSAGSIKRVLRPSERENPLRRLRAFVETSTVWHTIGQ